ncbi:LysR family transcriptional regulator [Synergistes jonesii]|uniref:HTH lysR-type domain-containing protein n=1 Tax=Synergistes jonesii TaxID=2754 RepID=A0A073ILX2_9BACT|nr:LysR family transcriptional regulator [Synergistes jonesii]KEJ91333.1 hypothetical protein EH55_10835 [Synergistes jonesii]OFB60401.1 hypothetical protein JS73_11705 [Synergistes jonesii]OFB61226.1 hypothetical protein JS79_11855 [Synergistes jonesii]OFB62891.1 hypothetical protein JS72_07575 [Synergistes jonesii]OFB66612.1 hypothetical protein JS78_11725 [Synergistes jonesii]
MTIQNLIEFLILAETKSIAKAAERLYVSPQGLSYSISKLEKELCVPLFNRTSRGMELNKYGQAIIVDAKQAVFSVELISQHISNCLKKDKKQVDIGVVNTLNIAFAPIIFQYYSEHCSNDVHYFIEEHHGQRLNEELLAERLDIGFTFDCYPNANIEFIPLHLEEWALLVNKEHPVAKMEFVTFEDLKGIKLALPNQYYRDFNYIMNTCKSRNIELEVMLAFNSGDSSVMSFLIQNLGAMFCATYIAREFIKNPLLTAVPIRETLRPYYSCIAFKKGIIWPDYINDLADYFINISKTWTL